MTRRRRASRLAAVTVVAVAGLVGWFPAPSSADAPQATGWWSRRLPTGAPPAEGAAGGPVLGLSAGGATPFASAAAPQQLPPLPGDEGGGTAPVTTLPLPVPPPTLPDSPVPLPEDPAPPTPNPTVPEGGLWVANDPAGAIAISALRFRGDIGAGELTLRFAPGSTAVGPVVVCPALSQFEPVAGGAWRDRPAHDCDRLSLTGRLTPEGTGLQFTIPQGFLPFGERVLDIIVLPDETRGDPFSLYFEPPGADTLVVTQGQELPPPPPELADPDPATLPVPAFEAPAAVEVPTFDAPVATVPEAPEEVAEAPVAAPEPVATVLEPFTESRTARIISVVVLLAMGATLWRFGGEPIRHPRLLGALAGTAPALVDLAGDPGAAGGIGRFRRLRAGPPTRL